MEDTNPGAQMRALDAPEEAQRLIRVERHFNKLRHRRKAKAVVGEVFLLAGLFFLTLFASGVVSARARGHHHPGCTAKAK